VAATRKVWLLALLAVGSLATSCDYPNVYEVENRSSQEVEVVADSIVFGWQPGCSERSYVAVAGAPLKSARFAFRDRQGHVVHQVTVEATSSKARAVIPGDCVSVLPLATASRIVPTGK
jgi:hypothetical protein